MIILLFEKKLLSILEKRSISMEAHNFKYNLTQNLTPIKYTYKSYIAKQIKAYHRGSHSNLDLIHHTGKCYSTFFGKPMALENENPTLNKSIVSLKS